MMAANHANNVVNHFAYHDNNSNQASNWKWSMNWILLWKRPLNFSGNAKHHFFFECVEWQWKTKRDPGLMV